MACEFRFSFNKCVVAYWVVSYKKSKINPSFLSKMWMTSYKAHSTPVEKNQAILRIGSDKLLMQRWKFEINYNPSL